VDGETLFAMHDMTAGDASARRGMPGPGVTENDRHRRQRFEVFFKDELQLVLIHRVGAEADAERINDGVAPGQLLFNLWNVPMEQLLVIDRHGRSQD
jgi:hypothetical protein